MGPALSHANCLKPHTIRCNERRSQLLLAIANEKGIFGLSGAHWRVVTARSLRISINSLLGKGSGQKRREIIETVITKGYAYRSIFLRVEEEVRKAVAKLTENRSNQLERIFNGLLEDFDTSFTVQEVDDPKRSQLIAQISEFIEETKTSSDGPIRDIFKKILEESMETFLVDHQDEIDKIELWHD